MHMAIIRNRLVLDPIPRGGAAAEGGTQQEEMADVEKEQAMGEARDVLMTKTATETETMTTMAVTESEAEALASND